MKIKDYLLPILKDKPGVPRFDRPILECDKPHLINADSLQDMKYFLLLCDEFKELTELHVTNFPVFIDNKNNTKTVCTFTVTDDLQLKNIFYLYSIFYEPEIDRLFIRGCYGN